MSVTCDVWMNEKDEVGQFEFANLPREGDTISLPDGTDAGFRHYKVDGVAHRASGPRHPSATFLFVSKEQ